MKKITFFVFVFFALTLSTFAQYSFPPVTGPTTVAQGSPVTLNINDAGNTATVPPGATGTYSSFSITADWSAVSGGPWSIEADLTITTAAGSVLVNPPTSGGANSGTDTILTFEGDLSGIYDPAVDATLDIILNQSYTGSSADWSNIVVTLFETPACPEPSGMATTSLTTTSVDLAWTAGNTESAWNIEYKAGADFTPGNGEEDVADAVSGTPAYSQSGLTEGTTYYVYYQADCGGDLSTWVGPFTFFTDYCQSVPSSNDGEGITQVVLGSTTLTSAGDVTYEDFTGTTVDLAQSVTANLQITFATGYTYGTNVWIDFNNDLVFDNTSELVYSGTSTNANPTTLDASFVMPAATNGIYRMRIGTADSGQFTPNPCYNGFYGVTADFTINITDPPACIPPSGLAATNVGGDVADINWTGNNGEAEWEYVVQPAGTGVPTTAGTITSSSTLNLTGLSYSTAYEVFVRANCGTGYSTWAGPLNFTTTMQTMFDVDCTAGPVNTTYCYDSNDTTSWTFTSNDGTPLRITFNTGNIEGNYDDIWIYDGTDNTGTLLFNNNNDIGGFGAHDLTGLVFDSIGDSLYIEIDTDGSVSCQSSSTYNTWDFDVICATCTNPTIAFALEDDCANGEFFFVEVDITDLGSATTLNLTDSIGQETQTATTAGIVNMGPYANGTDVVITVENADDSNCVVNSANFNLPACPPENDLCVDATEIACGESMSGDTSTAYSFDEPTSFCGTSTFGDAPGVWYTYTGTGDIVTASLCNSTFDTKIQVYSGPDCTDLSCVAGNDDNFAACGGSQSQVEFLSEVGTIYYIYVFGYSNSSGAYTLDLTCVPPPPPPANDECADATVLIANPDGTCTESATATVYGATASAEPNGCFGTADDDVWFEFTAVSTDHAITLYNVFGDTTDLYHALYEGDDCGNLTEIYCSDANDSVANGLTVGNTYKIRVYTWTGNPLQDVTFDICIFTIPPPITTNDTQYTVEELITDVLIDSECNQVFNITYSTGTDFGSTNGIGYFEANGSEWPFESGLILTSGDINNAPGPEDETLSDGGFGWPGDTDLEDVIPGLDPGDSNNATIVEFDFVPVIDHMSFDFIFASEEYGTFQCGFSDAFAFILTDANGVESNLAIVPGTVDPISVYTVRDNTFNGSCESVNPEFFANYYGNGGLSPLLSPTDFRGHTVIMTAEADVIPNDTYHIKLVIADALDTAFDSAVFLGAGTFDIGDLDLGDDILLTSGNASCEGDTVTLDAGELPNNSTISWYQDGQLISGATGTTLDVTTTAFYRADIVINNTDCTFTDEILVEFFPNPEPQFPSDSIIKCANESLTLEVDVPNANDPNMSSLTYVWTYNGVDVQTGPSNTYELTADAEEEGTFIVTVFDDVTACWGETQIEVEFYENEYCVDVPQGLSPNADGKNDCLILDHLEDREDISKAEVFNRYGTKVFELNDYVDQWCGTNQDGEILPVGTYFYIIYFNSPREPITSWIYLNY